MQSYPKVFLACHTRHVRDEESGQVVSAHQAAILDHLDEIEPTTLLALARHMGVTSSTMSLNVDRLVRSGYVKRERDATDARKVGLRLTKEGLRLKERNSVLDPLLVQAMLEGMNPTERAAGLAGLEMLARAASAFMESDEFKSMKRRAS